MSISIGVVGAGQFAPSFLTLFKAHPDVHDVRLTDLLPDRLAEQAERHEVATTYDSFEQMLDSDVDAVCVFTQRWTHGPLVSQALQAGKHVFSAVPMANSVEDCEAIIELVKSTGLTYMMAETSYYYPASVYCRQRRAAGDFGRIFYAEGDYVHDMDLGFYAAYQFSGGERWKETASFPPMLYPTHAVGSVLSVTEDPAVAVSCVGVPDERGDGVFDKSVSMFGNDISNATALFRTASGGSFRTNEFRRVGFPSHLQESRTRIYGTAGTFEQMTTSAYWQTKDGVHDVSELMRTRKPKDSWTERELEGVDPALRDAFTSGCAPVHDRSGLPASYTGLINGHQGSHQFLAHEFVRATVTGALPSVNAWVAARYTIPGIIAHESAQKDGAQLPVPDFGDAPR